MNTHYTFDQAKHDFEQLVKDLVYINAVKTYAELSALACGFNNVLINAVGITFEQVKELYLLADELNVKYLKAGE